MKISIIILLSCQCPLLSHSIPLPNAAFNGYKYRISFFPPFLSFVRSFISSLLPFRFHFASSAVTALNIKRLFILPLLPEGASN